MNDLLIQDNDLVLLDSSNDFAIDETDTTMSEVIEAFDMSIADDIDYPEIYSLQRQFANSDDPTDVQRRIMDAKRILKSLNLENLESFTFEFIK